MQKQNIGNAGEYYIASRLSAENFIATITLGRAERYDILALNPKGKTIKLSVKTQYKQNSIEFPLSVKDENEVSDDFYFAFVCLNEFVKEPDFWIIPSKIVAPIIKKSQEKWMETLGKENQKHKVTSIRILPIRIRKSQINFYPRDWEEKIKEFNKNIKQLMN